MRAALLALLALASMSTIAHAQSTRPASASTIAADQIDVALDTLASPDPTVRDAGRDRLMLLARGELPELRQRIEARLPLRAALWRPLREIVTHVYLSGRHNYQGVGPGYLGVRPSNDGQPPIVLGRIRGHDAFRALQDGDVIVGIALGGFDNAPMSAIGNFPALRERLGATRVGDWITVRVLRDGAVREVRLRVGPEYPLVPEGLPDPIADQADQFWQNTFERPLRRASTTRAAS